MPTPRYTGVKRQWAAALLLLLTSTSRADNPEQIAGATRVSAEELIALVTEIPELVLIDSRISANRKHGYIEGSYSLPDTKTDCRSLSDYLPSPDTPVAFYCNGVKCGRSVTATRIALSCGYRNIYWFRGGFEEWKAKRFPYLKQQ